MIPTIAFGVSLIAIGVSIWSYRSTKKAYDKIEAIHRKRVNETEQDFWKRSQ